MPQDPNAHLDQTVLDLIDHSPIGAVPATPSYLDAVRRLVASHQVYKNADHKGGFVTARALSRLPLFHAQNLDALVAGRIDAAALETDASIFARYVQSLPATLRPRAEAMRTVIAGKPSHHRAKHVGDQIVVAHDPIHTLFLVPGTGPNPGVPGNYLHGSMLQVRAEPASPWAVHVHDSDDGMAFCDAPTMAEALAKLQEVLESAPFTLDELSGLGFSFK